jgi:hypothetical protein
MQRLTSGKLHPGVVGGNPPATLDHHEHNITSAAQRAVGAACRDRELSDLRDVV